MKRTIFQACTAMVMVGACLINANANATTLIAFTLDELTAQSDEIVTGTITDSTSFLNENRIYTLQRVKVSEAVFGAYRAGDVVEVVTAGGNADTYSQKVYGAAELKVGEQYLLFLKRHSIHGILMPTGMSQGVCRIVKSSDNQKLQLMPLHLRARLVKRNEAHNRRFKIALPWLIEKRSLNEVLAEIRKIIENTYK